jgi:serine/threonine protein phosphatase PrpC
MIEDQHMTDLHYPSASDYEDVGARGYQEDRHINTVITLPDGNALTVLSVMDGHVGPECSDFLSRNFLDVIKSTIESTFAFEQPLDWHTVLSATNTILAQMTDNFKEGSTMSAVVLPHNESKAYVSVIGDSPVLIRDAIGNLVISPEHNAISNPEERQRAIAKGAHFNGTHIIGLDERGEPHGLMLTRALGDAALSRFLSREPALYSVDLGPDSFVIVASDGLLDPGHGDIDEVAIHIADLVESGADAEILVSDALARDTFDNVTAIVQRV